GSSCGGTTRPAAWGAADAAAGAAAGAGALLAGALAASPSLAGAPAAAGLLAAGAGAPQALSHRATRTHQRPACRHAISPSVSTTGAAPASLARELPRRSVPTTHHANGSSGSTAPSAVRLAALARV